MFEEIRRVLPKTDLPWVLLALQEDDVVRQTMTDSSFLADALVRCGSDPRRWSPGALGLVALSLDEFETPDQNKGIELTNAWQEKAGAILQDGIPEIVDLPQAATLALDLLGRFRQSGEWKTAFQSYFEKTGANLPTWFGSVLACLYSYAPDAQDLIKAFLLAAPAEEVGRENNPLLAVRAILSQPLPLKEQVQFFETLTKDMSEGQALPLLRALSKRRPGLAEKLAQALIQAHPELIRISDEIQGDKPLAEVLVRLDRLQEAIEICRMANLAEQGEAFLRQTEALTQALQAQLSAQLAFTSARKGESTPGKAKLLAGDEGSPVTQARLALSLIDGGQFDAAQEIAAGLKAAPQAEVCLVQARLAARQDSDEQTLRYARQALDLFRTRLAVDSNSDGSARADTARCLCQLAGLFLQLDPLQGSSAKDAVESAQMSLSLQPEQSAALLMLSRAQRLSGDNQKSLETAYLAVGLSPDGQDSRRNLAQVMEAVGEWEAALEAWQAVMDEESRNDPSSREDLAALASCAIRNGVAELAERAAQTLLDKNPQDSDALDILGQAALIQKGWGKSVVNWEAAVAYFNQAIQIQPHNRTYIQNLSNAYGLGGKIEEAMEAARKVLGLAPADRNNLLWFAAQTMRLKRPMEAADVLEWASSLYPQDLSLQTQLARVYHAANEKEKALVVLNDLRDAPVIQYKDLLDVAACFLDFGDAEKVLETLDLDGQSGQGLDASIQAEFFYLASRAYQVLGKSEDAMNILDKAIALCGVGSRREDMLLLKAELLLDLQQPAEAVACLDEIIHSNPQNGPARNLVLSILQQSGNLAGALDQARAMNAFPLAERLDAAEFALNMLEMDLAGMLLEGQIGQLDAIQIVQKAVLQAEFDLQLDGQASLEGIDQISLVDDQTTESLKTRFIALLARSNQSKITDAEIDDGQLSPADLITRGEAQIATGDYTNGLASLRKAAALAPLEPRAALALASGLVRCAEIQRLCTVTSTIRHAPGADALSPATQTACIEALHQATSRAFSPSVLVQRWEERARAVFEAPSDTRVPLSETLLQSDSPEDAAAYIASLSPDQALPELAGKSYDEHWCVRTACALALAEKPEEALSNALLASDRIPDCHPLAPILDVLVAGYARSAGDLDLASFAFQKAIRSYGDETAWLAQSAAVEAQAGDISKAVSQYELALALEPQNASLRLKTVELLMENAGQPERAARLLEELPADYALPAEIHAHMAESLLKSGSAAQAVEYFLKTIRTAEQTKTEWDNNLAQGLAQAATLSGEKAVAVQALNEALRINPSSPDLWQALSEVSLSVGQNVESVQAAHQALALRPDDGGMQAWYAEQTMCADEPLEAVALLSRLVKSNPQEINLYVRLARALMCAGRKDDALATLRYARLAPGTGLRDLLDAAQGLLDINEAEAAVACLERARSEFIEMDQDEQFALQLSLADAHARSGNPELGLQAALDAAKLKPDALALTCPLQARIHEQMGNLSQAKTVLDQFIAAEPDNPTAREQMISLLRKVGDGAGVLEQVRVFVDYPLTSRIGAAETALQFLELDLAETLLKGEIAELDIPDRVRFACTSAELALERDADAAVAGDVSLARSLTNNSSAQIPPELQGRVHALEARTTCDKTSLRNALAAPDKSVYTLVNLADAQSNVGDFSGAEKTLQKAASIYPQEPRIPLALAKNMVRAAEAARFCDPLKVVRHAPALAAASAAYERCNEFLQAAHSRALTTSPLVQRWSARAQAVFDGSQAPDAGLLAGTAEDIASYAGALARSAGIDHPLEGAHAETWRVLAANAAGLASSAPQAAFELARQAAEQIPENHFYAPLVQMWIARLARQTGKPEEALQAVQQAVRTWGDEPHWRLEAAELSAENGDIPAVLEDVEAAVALEPQNGVIVIHAAKILMEKAGQPQRAAAILNSLGEETQPPAETWVELGEALLEEYPAEAFSSISRAIAAGLADNGAWRSRLALGFSAAAVGSSQPVPAIEVIQRAVNAESDNPVLWQALSNVLTSAGLTEEALDAARQVLALLPADVPAMLWFADRAIQLDRSQDAIAALARAVKTDMRNVPVHLKLAHALLKAGQRPQALAALERIVHMPSATFPDLLGSADHLLEFGEPALAIACLERARKEYLNPDTDEQYRLLMTFAKAFQKNGSPQAGLEAAESAGALKPEALGSVNALKADLYLQLEKPQDALLSLQAALDAEPQNAELRLRIMNLQRALGDMTGAITHARQFLQQPLPERLEAADFALQMLELDLANDLLDGEASRLSISARAKHTTLKVELALERDATTDLSREMLLGKRLLDDYAQQMDDSLRARLAAMEARLMMDEKAFQEMRTMLGSNPPAGLLISAAEAGISTGNFKVALEYAHRAALSAAQEARPHLVLARSLVRTAEMQRLCAAVGASRHAPGDNALSKDVYETVKDALGAAAGRVFNACPAIQRWAWRAEAVFTSAPAETALLAITPDDAASYIEGALALSVPINEIPPTPFQDEWRVQAASAFAISRSNPTLALEKADLALEKCPPTHFLRPLLLVLRGDLAAKTGNLKLAAGSLQNAVLLWQDEPGWLLQTARLTAPQDTEKAVQYVEAAIVLDAEDNDMLLQAAQILMDEAGEPLKAAALLAKIQGSGLVSAEMNVNLAEALSQKGYPAESISVYRKVFDSSVAASGPWQARIALGFAKAATQNQQPATAIAALQDAVSANPKDAGLYQALSDAYSAANLPTEAMDAARQALAVQPADPETLLWFARRALALNDPLKAVEALGRVTQMDSHNVPALLELSQAYRKTNQRREALTTLERIVHLPDLNAEDLLNAARHLMDNDEPGLAIACLERARMKEEDVSNETRFDLLLTLAQAQKRTGNPEAGLEALEIALSILPTSILQVNPLKAELYAQMDKPQAAIACLEQVLGINPEDANARYQMIKIMRSAGDLNGALEHAKSLQSGSASSGVRSGAASFALQMMQPELAHSLLGNLSPAGLTAEMSHAQRAEFLDIQFLSCELSLERGLYDETQKKVEGLESQIDSLGLQLNPEQTACLAAIRSRLAVSQMDASGALKAYQQALAALDEEAFSQNALQAVFGAALEVGDWNQAHELARQVAESNQPEPRPYLDLCRVLVKRAEAQRICQKLDIQSHAPGAVALSDQTREEFNAAVRNATQRATAVINGHNGTHKLDTQAIPTDIQRWWVRGRFAFDDVPSQEVLLALSKIPSSAEDTAAYIAALGRVKNTTLAAQVSRDYPNHPAVQLALALALADESPDEAYRTAQDLLKTRSVTPLAVPEALAQALLAYTAQQAGEIEISRAALLKALDLWDDEAGWHVQAAEFEQEAGNLDGALAHLTKGVHLEPERTDYLTKLGQVYLRLSQPESAEEVFEVITRLNPEDAGAWLAHGKVSLALGNADNAEFCAEQVVRLKPDILEGHLLQARTALQKGDARGGYKAARAAMQLDREQPEVYMVLSQAFEGLGESEKALRALEKAAEVSSEPLQADLERIQLLRRLNGDVEAMPALQDLADEYPENAAVLALVADVLAKAEKYEAALQAAQIALQNGAGVLDEAQQSDMHHLVGKIFQHAGQLDQALNHLVEAVRLNPEKVDPQLDLGMVYQERRQHSQALQIFKKVIKLAPNDARPYHLAGVVMKESRDYASAEKMLQKAARLAPSDLRIQRTLASVAALNLVHGK